MSVIGRPAKPLVSLIWINLDEVRRLAAASCYAPNYRGAGYYTGGGPHASISYAGYFVQDYATLNGFVCHLGSLTGLAAVGAAPRPSIRPA